MELQDYSRELSKNARIKKIKSFCGHTENISPLAGVIFILATFSLYAVMYYVNDISTRPLYNADEEEDVDQFVAERARDDLKELTDIGPRVVGTHENEVLTVEFLKKKISNIIERAHKNQKLEFDLQVVSGIYNSSFSSSSASTRIYESVQNLLVKVHANNFSEYSLLINAHFDSVPTSPGGSDNGINCVVALEALRKISQSPKTFVHNLVFLFNGAEEIGSLGAHGFTTQHRWAREITAFLNLDSMGAGGKIALFQMTPGHYWLLKYVKQIELPIAQVVTEELYESKLLPFDTDYTVLTLIGKTAGLNFLFTRNGRRYHTRYDNYESVPLSTYQHAGNTVLKLLHSLANSSELKGRINKESGAIAIYYDCAGLFLIYYSNTIGVVINLVLVVLSVLVVIKSFYDLRIPFKRYFEYVALSLLGLLSAWFVAAGFVTIIAVCLDSLPYSMIWYNNSWIVLGLYVIPVFLICFAFTTFFKRFIKSDITYNMHAQLQLHVIRLIWTTTLFLGTCLGIRSTYVVAVAVFFHTWRFIFIHITCSQYTRRTWQIIYFIFTIPEIAFSMHILLSITSTLLTSFGYSKVNSELYVAFLYLFFTVLISSSLIPFAILIRRSYIVILTYSTIFVISLVTLFTPLTFPYSDDSNSPAPQRFIVFYENTIIREGPENSIYGRYKDLTIVSSDHNCNRTLQSYIVEPEFVKETDMIPIQMTTKIRLNSKIYVSDSQTHYNFTIDGCSKMEIDIKTESNVTIANGKIYLTNREVILKSNSTFYNLRYDRGKESRPFVLILKTRHLTNATAPLLRFHLKSEYLYNVSTDSIPYFNKYLNQFPSWTNVDARIKISDSAVF